MKSTHLLSLLSLLLPILALNLNASPFLFGSKPLALSLIATSVSQVSAYVVTVPPFQPNVLETRKQHKGKGKGTGHHKASAANSTTAAGNVTTTAAADTNSTVNANNTTCTSNTAATSMNGTATAMNMTTTAAAAAAANGCGGTVNASNGTADANNGTAAGTNVDVDEAGGKGKARRGEGLRQPYARRQPVRRWVRGAA